LSTHFQNKTEKNSFSKNNHRRREQLKILLNSEELDIKNQGAVGRDQISTDGTVAVGVICKSE
jgi:hypothetical protein